MIQVELTLPAHKRGFHLITEFVEGAIELPNSGVLHIFIQHTSAGLTINENADPSVQSDLEASFNSIVKENEPYYRHIYEGPDDMPAHIKATMVGSSVTVPITNGRLNLGRWQGVYLCEFRNRGGERNLVLTVLS